MNLGTRRTRLTAAAIAMAVTAMAMLGLTAATAAATTADFTVPGAQDQLALAGGHVFDWSYDLNDNEIHVLDLAGHEVATIPDEPDVQSLTVSPDGARIYAALRSAKAVSVIDTGTLTETVRYDVSKVGAPYSATEAGHWLYVVASAYLPQGTHVVALDRNHPAGPPVDGPAFLNGTIAVRAAGASSDIYVADCGLTELCDLRHYRYAGEGWADPLQSTTLPDIRNLAVTGDGHVLAQSAYTDSASLFGADDLAAAGTVPAAHSGFGLFVASGRVVEVGYDPVAQTYRDVQVRDRAGALIGDYPQPAGVQVLHDPSSDDLYAAGPDGGVTHLHLLAGALGEQAVPDQPLGLGTAPGPHGDIALVWLRPYAAALNAPTGYRLYRSYTAGQLGTLLATLPDDVTIYTDRGLATGARPFYSVVATDAAGTSTPSSQMTATADATAPVPVITSPAAQFSLGNHITVSYGATDQGSGPAMYYLRYRVGTATGGFGPYGRPTAWQDVITRTQTLIGQPGKVYCISVQARDRVGNLSGWSPDRCTAIPVDDRALTAVTSGWTRVASPGSYAGTLTRTSVAGATLQYRGALADRLALVVATCPGCGDVRIYLNGVYWRTVSTASATVRRQVIAIQPPFSHRVTTIQLRAGSAGRSVLIDGLGIYHT